MPIYDLNRDLESWQKNKVGAETAVVHYTTKRLYVVFIYFKQYLINYTYINIILIIVPAAYEIANDQINKIICE